MWTKEKRKFRKERRRGVVEEMEYKKGERRERGKEERKRYGERKVSD
jgi:hypothetical protein